MKTYLLNQVPHHNTILGSEGVAPCILNLSTRWKWLVSFMSQSL